MMVAGVGALASVVAMTPAVESLSTFRGQWLDRSHELATIVPDEPAVVLLDSSLAGTDPGLGYRDVAYNDANLAGRTVYGIARPERVAPVAERFPDRAIVYDIENYVLPFGRGEVDFVDVLGFPRGLGGNHDRRDRPDDLHRGERRAAAVGDAAGRDLLPGDRGRGERGVGAGLEPHGVGLRRGRDGAVERE